MRIVAGKAGSRTIEAPKGRDTRPTLDRVRENLFNILQNRIHDAAVLDLFAGSGALSLEAVSRGAAFAVLCDRDAEANRVERKNAHALGFEEQMRILRCDWKEALAYCGREKLKFDLVFLDPPYAMEDLTEVTEAVLPLLEDDGQIIIEHKASETPAFSAQYRVRDRRRYGYCGLLFLERIQS